MGVDFDDYDCLDIGADTNSLAWSRLYLGSKRPLGLNIEPVRLQRMRDAGEDCVSLNALEIPSGVKFDFIFMSHFLEHLRSEEEVNTMLSRSARMALKGVYIAGPHFEDDDYLRHFGLKFIWGDWVDHTSRFGISTFVPYLQKNVSAKVTLSLGFPVVDSEPDNIVAIDEKPDLDSYARQRTVDKRSVGLPRPLYQEFLLLIDKTQEGNLAEITQVHEQRHGMAGQIVSG